MLGTLSRLFPVDETRRLVALVAWLTAAAVLHGVTLGLGGVSVAALLDADRSATPWLVALTGTAVLFVVAQWVAQMHAFRTGSETARALHSLVGDHVAALPLGWFTPSRQAGLIDTATTGVPQLMSYPAILLRPALTAIVTPLAAAATLAVIDLQYALAVVAATVVALLMSRVSRRLAGRVDARRHEVTVETTDRVLEYATLQPTIRTDAHVADDSDLDRALYASAVAARRSTVTVLPGLVLFGLTLNALFAGLVGLGVAWVSAGGFTVPALVGLIVVTVRLTSIATAGADLAAGLRLQRGALDRVAAVLRAEPLPVIGGRSTTVSGHGTGSDLARMENVSFGYDQRRPVLDGVSLALPRHGLTALVGPSGSGKTTMMRLLARFWDPDEGRILLSGADLRSVEPDDLYARIAMVLQDDYLLDGTIEENIRAGRPSAGADEVEQAVAAAALTSTVDDLPHGLDTPVGRGGARLSGGQRQRVCVARALLKAAPLTLLDEATSALDPGNATLVGDAARRLSMSSSVLVIAHNLETVVHADQVLVLDGGRLVQRGTHAELVDQPGTYRTLLRSRRSAR